MKVLKFTKVAVLGLFLAASLTLNVATVAFTSVATLVGAAYETVTGARAVTTGLKEQLRDRDEDIVRLRHEVSTRERRIASLTDEVTDLRASREVTYRGKRVLVSEAVEDSTARITRRTATNATRNVASTFGEAIPLIGIAVVASVTALEINDACQTMKDLHELDVAFNPENATDEGASEVCGLQVPSVDELRQAAKDKMPDLWPFGEE